jgi:hypothetical protein
MARRGMIVVLAGLMIATAASAEAGSRAAIKGRVIDQTCYGPCVDPPVVRPFDGPGDVVVRRLPSRSVAARTEVADSRFRVVVGPGKYLVKVIPYPDDAGPLCWIGSRKRVVLDTGEVARPKLVVSNRCVL